MALNVSQIPRMAQQWGGSRTLQKNSVREREREGGGERIALSSWTMMGGSGMAEWFCLSSLSSQAFI